MLTALLKGGAQQINPPIALEGDGGLRYDLEYDLWRGNGFNSVKPTSATFTVNFTPAPDLAAGKTVTINLVETGTTRVVTLTNNTAANLSLAALLVSEVTGASISGGISIADGQLTGYSATAVGNTVTIKGKPGVKLAVNGSGFGTAGQPAAPTITEVNAAVCTGILPFGRAVVVDPTANYTKSRTGSVIANEPSSIVSLPTGSTTATIVGVTVRDIFGVYDYDKDCCGNEDNSQEGYECHECAHYLKLMPGNPQQIKITLELPQAGDTVPANILETPLSYREAGVAGATQKGTFSVGAPVGDTNRKLMRNTANGSQLVIKGIIDVAKRQYFVGVSN
jgi:hypothetical protein